MKRTTFFKDISRGFVVRAGLRVDSPLCFVNCVWGLHLSPVSLGLQELSQEEVWVHRCLTGPWSLFEFWAFLEIRHQSSRQTGVTGQAMNRGNHSLSAIARAWCFEHSL